MDNKDIFKFEYLPNEILIHLFDYLDIRDIYEGFSSLNARFQALFQPFENFRLIISNNRLYDLDRFAAYVDTLIIKDDISFELKALNNVRHIISYVSNEQILSQINRDNLPCLEYIGLSNNVLIQPDLYQRIFSNRFFNLKYCNLCVSLYTHWKQRKMSFPLLKMGGIDLNMYQLILSNCPNLFYLKFRMLKSDNQSITIPLHRNLKRLMIDIEISQWPYNHQLIDRFLQCVPNVEYLNIYTSNFTSVIKESIIEYDWLAPVISSRLLFLQKFLFFFRLKWFVRSNELKDLNILPQLKENFLQRHHPRYQSRLTIKLLR